MMPGKPFERGHRIGRPRGSRNRLASQFLDDLIEIWNEPISKDNPLRRGPAALRIMSRDRPHEFAKIYASVLPKEFLVQSVASELDDDELDRMIEALRQRVLEAREERALDQALQMKLLGASKHDCQRLVPGRRGLPNCALPASPLGDSGRL